MKKLSADWITEGTVDFEYKKYILLAYLKNVSENFSGKKLYPFMSDLVAHYNHLLNINDSSRRLAEGSPKEVTGLDLQNQSIIYRQNPISNYFTEDIFTIVEYALPKMKDMLENGRELYEWIEEHTALESVGLIPLYKKEGYLLVVENTGKNVLVFRYNLSNIKLADGNYVALNTTFIMKDRLSLSNTVNNIKLKLIKTFSQLPNPATYTLISKLSVPFKSALLPIGSRMLMRRLAA